MPLYLPDSISTSLGASICFLVLWALHKRIYLCAGVNTAIYSASGASSGVGFAIPVDAVRRSVEQIIRVGKVVHPVIGISFAPDQASEEVGTTVLQLVHGQDLLACMSCWQCGRLLEVPL